jgi:hypothetical protein
MSSNLPPGVTERMLPGNTPEDEAEEAFFETVYDRLAVKHGAGPLGQLTDDESTEELLHSAIGIARDIAYAKGMQDERDSAALEKHFDAESRERLADELLARRDALVGLNAPYDSGRRTAADIVRSWGT